MAPLTGHIHLTGHVHKARMRVPLGHKMKKIVVVGNDNVALLACKFEMLCVACAPTAGKK